MLVDNVNSWADNSWPTEQTAVWEKHLNIRRPKDTLLAQAEPALRFSTCSSLVAGPSLLREVRPSCSIYGGTHLASDRVFGWLTNMFPLGFKSHVEPNVTVDFFLFFSLQTHFRRNEKEMPGELEGDWLPNYTVNCCSFQQRITRLTNLGHLFCRSPISNYSRLRKANPAVFKSQLTYMHVRHQHHSVFVSMGCCTSEPLGRKIALTNYSRYALVTNKLLKPIVVILSG